MAKLIYSMITSLDGYSEAAEGDLGCRFASEQFEILGSELFLSAHLAQHRESDQAVNMEQR